MAYAWNPASDRLRQEDLENLRHRVGPCLKKKIEQGTWREKQKNRGSRPPSAMCWV